LKPWPKSPIASASASASASRRTADGGPGDLRYNERVKYMEETINIVDAHVDIADIYRTFGYAVDDFFAADTEAPVTLPKITEAGISVLGFSLYCDKSSVKTSFYDGVKENYAFYEDLLSRTDRFRGARTAADLADDDKIKFLYAIEGFDCLRTPDDFSEFYEMGARCFGPAWNNNNAYASGRGGEKDYGLTEAGREVVKMMNGKKKLLADISHLSPRAVKDLDKTFDGLIVATHANAAAVFQSKEARNLLDDEISIIAERGGVVGLFPLAPFTGAKGTFDELLRHLDHIVGRWGMDHVAFASDIYPLPEYPFCHGHKDILIMKHLREFLLKHLTAAETKKVLYGNWSRVLGEALS
jgi:membrane dipeptidase